MPSLVRLLSALAGFVIGLTGAANALSPPARGTADAPGSTGAAQRFRLPSSVVPSRYRIKLTPDLTDAVFDGEETIDIAVKQPVRSVTLNANDLTIKSAALLAAGGRQLPCTVSINEKLEQATITPPTALSPGDYRLNLSFKGVLNDKLCGFYRAHFNDSGGRRHTIATTQMEPTDARRMFPCFDEPEFKATYQLTAVVDPKLTAISNAPTTSEAINPKSKKKEVVFADTPRMSTYLLALVVGDFEASKPTTVAGVPIRVWAVRGKSHLGNYAQQFTGRLLPWYNAYFGIPYPAKKLDLIAIPDFEAGAMENLGAITFRETLLLVDEKTASTETKQHCAGVVAHEMAHMWFGDLVTMKWWDDLWLNEAFATWMATKSVDKLMPAWHRWESFALGRTHALSTDSLISTRPIHFAVGDPAQANEMFDEITYTKGASVLRMLEQFVGEGKFRKGIHDYLARHSWGNATTGDLWKAIGAASAQPVPAIMSNWVSRPGYPLVSVRPMPDGKRIAVSQKRFLLDGRSAGESTLWQVPVRASAWVVGKEKSEMGASTLLIGRDGTLRFARPKLPLIANAGASGYYRVAYDDGLLRLLIPHLQSLLKPAERLSLLSDQWSLAVAGQGKIDSYLNLTSSFKNENDPNVMTALIGHLDYLNGMVDSSERKRFESFVRDRLATARQRLGWNGAAGEPDEVRLLRGRVLETLGTIGQETAVIKEARKRFSAYLRDPLSLSPDLIGPTTRIVAYNGDSEDFDHIRQSWLEARTPEQEERNLMALALFQSPDLIKKALSLSISDEVRSQDGPHVLGSLIGNDAARALAWRFVKDNWATIIKRFPMNMVPRMVSAASSMSTTPEENDLRTFFAIHPVPAGNRAVARMLERVHINVGFRARSSADLKSWLAENFAVDQISEAHPAQASHI